MMEDDVDRFTYVFLFFICAIIYYLLRKSAGDYTIRKPVVEIFVVAFLIIASNYILWVSRYYMPHVAVNGFSGSILGRPIRIKDSNNYSWVVFNTGEFLEPFHGKGKLATLVVPAEQINLAGRNYVGLTLAKKTPVQFLPPIVHKFLMRNSSDFNIKNVYFGKYDEEFIHENPKIVDMEEEIEGISSQVNLRNDLLEGRNDILIEHRKFAEELTGSKSHWYDVFKRKKEADQEQ